MPAGTQCFAHPATARPILHLRPRMQAPPGQSENPVHHQSPVLPVSTGQRASLLAQTVNNLPALWRPGFKPWVRKIPWRREWLPTPVFLPRETHGQRSLTGYSPCGHKELDTTERLQKDHRTGVLDPPKFFSPELSRYLCILVNSPPPQNSPAALPEGSDPHRSHAQAHSGELVLAPSAQDAGGSAEDSSSRQ